MKILYIYLILLFSFFTQAEELLKNGSLEVKQKQKVESFTLVGDVSSFNSATLYENGSFAVALNAGKDLNKNRRKEGSISQIVGVSSKKSKWYRFSFKGLPQSAFKVSRNSELFVKVNFYAKRKYRDHVRWDFYDLVKKQRADLDVNGVRLKYGAAVWRTYDYEFMLPFNEIDKVKISIEFKNGKSKESAYSSFQVDDLSLIPIDKPSALVDSYKIKQKVVANSKLKYKLVPLGGRWYFKSYSLKDKIFIKKGLSRVFNFKDENSIVYKTDELETPFAGNMQAWMQPGFLDSVGTKVTKKYLLKESVKVQFSDKYLIMTVKNIPNHLTGKFPGYLNNPSSIGILPYAVYFPLYPLKNPKALAMDNKNKNSALNLGAVGLAINGVPFFNPFDLGMSEAINIMDRCCGHPNQFNQYHYHKYPVCVRSPFVDEGKAHSRLIGFALDGFPLYGPYERDGVMAMDDKKNPLNNFNIHHDKERGWHYHVTPGKFPYIIGGYFGFTPLQLRGK